MDIDNDAIVSGGNFLFCEVGDRLALQFISAARCIVQLADCADPCELADKVDSAMAALLSHRYSCRTCQSHDEFEPAPRRFSKYFH
jgi:hypothetical protein